MSAKCYIVSLSLFLVCIFGCGRMGDPFTPEELAPQAVRKLTVTPLAEGIEFKWNAPRDDIRGEPLKSLDEYRISRKAIESPEDFLDPEIEYVDLKIIPDQFIENLKQLEDEALAQGMPRRKVKVDPQFENYSFVDKDVELGKRYVYQVLAVNQGGVLGQTEIFADIVFDGLNSKISLTERILEEQVGQEQLDQNQLAQ